MSVLPSSPFGTAAGPAFFGGLATTGGAADGGTRNGAELLLAPQHPELDSGVAALATPLAGCTVASAASSSA